MGNGQFVTAPVPGAGNVARGPASVFDLANPLVLVGGVAAFVPPGALPTVSTSIPAEAQLAPVTKPAPGMTGVGSVMGPGQTANLTAGSSVDSLKQQWLDLAVKVGNDVDTIDLLKRTNPDPVKLANAQTKLTTDSNNLNMFIKSLTPSQVSTIQGKLSNSEAAVAAKASSQLSMPAVQTPTMGQPSNVNITPAEYDLLPGFGAMGSGLGQLMNSINPMTPITQLPAQLPATITNKAPNVVGNQSAFTPGYLEWKRRADPWDYLSARKYFTFRDYMSNEYLEDWYKYGEFKQGKWRDRRDYVTLREYLEWKDVACEDDSRRYAEWRRWNSLKAKYKAKFQPQLEKYMQSKKAEYQKFWKSLKRKNGYKEFCKFCKFQAWQTAAMNSSKDVLNMDAYHKWSKTYIPNDAANREAFENRKPSDENLKKWIDWMRFEKVRAAEADDTEASQSYPFWYKNTKNYQRRYRRWWDKSNGRDQRREQRDARRGRRDEESENSSDSD